MPDDEMITELRDERERELAFPVLRELRTDLDGKRFRTILQAATRAEGYRLYGAFREGSLVAVMGVRELHDFVHGHHLYVDDLVVTERARGGGTGARLLRFAESLARELGCEGLRLCTGTGNERGRKFYEREGWDPRAVAFKKKLERCQAPFGK